MSEKHFPSTWQEAIAFEWAKKQIEDDTTPEALSKTYLDALDKIKAHYNTVGNDDWSF